MYEWHIRDRVLHVDPQVLVMGIVNVTPDSFSDGGQHLLPAEAIAHGLELVRQGADILDVGGESTRPGAPPVALDEELRRVLPVVKELAGRTDVPLSIDTYKAGVADACLAAGAHIVNDITALQGDKDMASVVAPLPGRRGADAHAGNAGDHATGPALPERRGRRPPVSRRTVARG